MGGMDKGLQLLRGRPMIAWVIDRLAPQVSEIFVNANQNLDQYRKLGPRVVCDEIGGFAGPLAGVHAGLTASSRPLLATCPCDSPFLPLDLVSRLRASLDARGGDLAVARTGDQPQPVFSLVRRRVLPHLAAFLESGGRKFDAWYAALDVVEVPFDDQEQAFCNINTREELASLENNPGKMDEFDNSTGGQSAVRANIQKRKF